jgi:hypothetical protein
VANIRRPLRIRPLADFRRRLVRTTTMTDRDTISELRVLLEKRVGIALEQWECI